MTKVAQPRERRREEEGDNPKGQCSVGIVTKVVENVWRGGAELGWRCRHLPGPVQVACGGSVGRGRRGGAFSADLEVWLISLCQARQRRINPIQIRCKQQSNGIAELEQFGQKSQFVLERMHRSR